MKKIFIFVLTAVLFVGCEQNLTSSESSDETSTAATSDFSEMTEMTETVLTETTSTVTNIDTPVTTVTATPKTTMTTTAKTTTSAVTAPPKVTVTTVPPVITAPPVTTTAKIIVESTTAQDTITDYQQEVVNLVNTERAKMGLNELSVLSDIQNAAQIRASELISSFSHTRPNGTSCFTVLNELQIRYTSSGENIAAGQKTPADAMNSWMNSSGHKANILNSTFTHIGVGYVEGGNYGTNWVQMFVKLA